MIVRLSQTTDDGLGMDERERKSERKKNEF
jgi:hypothetical protein